MSLRLTCSTGGGSRSSNAGRRCSYRRSIGVEATTDPSESSFSPLHHNKLLGSTTVPLLLIDNTASFETGFPGSMHGATLGPRLQSRQSRPSTPCSLIIDNVIVPHAYLMRLHQFAAASLAIWLCVTQLPRLVYSSIPGTQMRTPPWERSGLMFEDAGGQSV